MIAVASAREGRPGNVGSWGDGYAGLLLLCFPPVDRHLGIPCVSRALVLRAAACCVALSVRLNGQACVSGWWDGGVQEPH